MVYDTGNNKGQIPSFNVFKYENNFILKHWTAFTKDVRQGKSFQKCTHL